jgi:hypothetical protein
MKHNFRYLLGVLALALPFCLNAQEEKIDRTPKISGFVQGLWQGDLNKDGKVQDNTFRARRVRISFEGTLAKNLTYKIQGDFSRSPMMVDAFVKYKPCKAFAIQAGQFKTPFSIESPINPVNLEIFDYGESVQHLVGYSDVCGLKSLGRDLGIMTTGDLIQLEGKDFSLVKYSFGVFNGTGVNTTDNNNRKDFVGKLEIHPMLKDLTLSGSYYYGWYDNDDIHNGKRNRWSAGIQYNDGDLVVRAEYLDGTTGYASVDSNGKDIEEYWLSQGYYAVAGYNFLLGKDKSQKLMPVLRYEHFAKDTNVANGGNTYYTVGINYWPVKSLNFKLDYSLIQPDKGDNSHRVVGILSYKF